MLRYRCLVLDHDDTLVDSSRRVNYPQFRRAIAALRPGVEISEEAFILYCYDPGFYPMCREVLHYTDEELSQHEQAWLSYLETHKPPFFDGIPALLARVKAEGGLVCVVSHSYAESIRAVFSHHGIAQPDSVFGAEYPVEQRKPNPFPLEEIMRRYALAPEDILVVDDMQHGCNMAHACGVDFACAAWYGMPESLAVKMREISDHFFLSVSELSALLFT